MKTPDNSIDFEVVDKKVAVAEGSPAGHAARMVEVGKRNEVNLELQGQSPADKERIKELHAHLGNAPDAPKVSDVSPEKPKEVPKSVETKTGDKEPFAERIKRGNKDIFNFLGNKINPNHGINAKRPGEMSSSELMKAISDREITNHENAKGLAVIGAGAGAVTLTTGVFAPAIIGLTPALAAALPAAMTSTIAIGGVAIASSVILLSGVGVGVAALGYGAYKLKSFFNKRSAEKARIGASDREWGELL